LLLPTDPEKFRLVSMLLIAGSWFGVFTMTLAEPILRARWSNVTRESRFAVKTWSIVITLTLAISFFIGAYTWLSLTRHDQFNSTGYDLAINEQIVWNTLNGRFFASSVEVDNSFGDHFRPMLLILVPIYAFSQTPQTLLIIQVLVLASAAIPIYYLAKLKLQDDVVAAALAMIYLLYPAIGFVVRFDFHIEIFVIPAFIAAFYMMETGRWQMASFFLVIPLLCKENMGFTVTTFGLYALLRWKKYKWGGIWAIVGILFTWLTTFWLLPLVRGEAIDTLSRYAWLGSNPLEMMQMMLMEPFAVAKHLFTEANMLYALQLLLPVGLLAIFGFRELLLGLPALAINLLSNHFCQSTIYCHYTIPIIPIIFIATVFGLLFIKEHLPEGSSWRLYALIPIVLTCLSFWVSNPFQETSLLPSAFEQIGNAEVVKMALDSVPADGVLVTTNDYASHLARRPGLYIIGIPSQREAPIDPDIIFLNLYDQQYILCDQIQEYIQSLAPDDYGATFRTGGLIVLQRNAGSAEQFIDFRDNWNNCAG
jgi:uncharacterized membrane protein